VEWLCREFGCELVVLNDRELSPEQELITDMLSIVHCFSSRLYGLRKYQKQISEELRQEQLQEIPECSPEQECQDTSISL
jgi:predicted site-specific integrase-resolvase